MPRTKARAKNHKTDTHGLTTTIFVPFSPLPGNHEVEGWRVYKRGFRWGIPVAARSGVFRLCSVRDPVGCELNVAFYVYRPFSYSVKLFE
jgi:hypothetical protein